VSSFNTENDVRTPDGISKTLCSRDYKGAPLIQIPGNLYGTETEPNPQAGRVYSPDGISPTLTDTSGHGGREIKIAIPVLTPDRTEKRQNGRRFKGDGEDMFTLTAQDRHGVVTSEMRIRKITPRECWRLQGFSDEAFDKAAAVNSKTQLYKQAGNSIMVPVAYEIAKRLKELEEQE